MDGEEARINGEPVLFFVNDILGDRYGEDVGVPISDINGNFEYQLAFRGRDGKELVFQGARKDKIQEILEREHYAGGVIYAKALRKVN